MNKKLEPILMKSSKMIRTFFKVRIFLNNISNPLDLVLISGIILFVST